MVATVTQRGFSKSCTLPKTGEIEKVIALIIGGGDGAPPDVTLSDYQTVCRAYDKQQDLARAVSVVVEYTCSGHASCPAGRVLEQIESECIAGQWTNSVLGSTAGVHSPTIDHEATLTTTTREDCSFCLSPYLASHRSLTTDIITHCVGESVHDTLSA